MLICTTLLQAADIRYLWKPASLNGITFLMYGIPSEAFPVSFRG